MRHARFTVSAELLGNLLHTPLRAQFIHAEVDRDGDVVFTMSDPDLPEADRPHETTPTVTHEAYVWDWGVS